MPKPNSIETSSMSDISQYNLMNIKSMNKQICSSIIQPDIPTYYIPSKQKQITGNLGQYDVVEHFKRGIICDDSKK